MVNIDLQAAYVQSGRSLRDFLIYHPHCFPGRSHDPLEMETQEREWRAEQAGEPLSAWPGALPGISAL